MIKIGEIWQDNFKEQEAVKIVGFQSNFVLFKRPGDDANTITFVKEFVSNYYIVGGL